MELAAPVLGHPKFTAPACPRGVDAQLLAALTERIAQMGQVLADRLLGAVRSHVPHVSSNDLPHCCLSWKKVVFTPILTGLELPLLLEGDLIGSRLE
jgi:hypothetical protein